MISFHQHNFTHKGKWESANERNFILWKLHLFWMWTCSAVVIFFTYVLNYIYIDVLTKAEIQGKQIIIFTVVCWSTLHSILQPKAYMWTSVLVKETQVVWITSLLPADSAHLPLDRRPNRISQIRAGTNDEKHKFSMHNWWPIWGEWDTTGTNYNLSVRFCQGKFCKIKFSPGNI